MIDIDDKTTVRDVVVTHPQTRAALERLGIDYCCGGGENLRQAVEQRGLEYRKVLATLDEASRSTPKGQIDTDWSKASMADLATHIVNRHHEFLRRQLPQLDTLLRKVTAAHRASHGEMLEKMHRVFASLKGEIEMHLDKEEAILFPYITELDAYVTGRTAAPVMHCGSVENPIRQMMREHDIAGEVLAELARLSSNYTAPEDACPSFTALFEGLKAVQDDLHEHIHLENNILFPWAIAAEKPGGAT